MGKRRGLIIMEGCSFYEQDVTDNEIGIISSTLAHNALQQ